MRLLYDIPAPLLALLLFIAMVGALEAAQRLGDRLEGDGWQRSRDVFVTVAGGVLGLLGLMLAFSFSMSVTRYEARKTLLLKEDNTIVSVHLRSDLLLPAQRAQLRGLLRQYGEQRVAFLKVGHDEEGEGRAVDQANALQAQMWPLVAAADNYPEPRAIGLSLLGSAVNDMLLVARERQAARANRVPEPVLWMLFTLAVLAGAAVGYAFGASRHRSRIFTVTFALLVCMVVYIIIDLDRPRRGLIQIDPAPLQEVLAAIGR